MPQHPPLLLPRRTLPHHQLWLPGTAGTLTRDRSCWTQPETNKAKKVKYKYYELQHLEITYLGELHLIHALSSVPMQESLAPEHGSELLTDALKELLDGSAVANKSARHLQTARWDITDGSLHVVGDPLHKVRAVLVLDVQHLLVHLLHGHASTEHGGNGEVPAVARITGSHHVLGIEHLLSQLGNGQSSVLLGATAGERGKPGHKEVETREGNHVDSQLAQVGIELTGESEAGGDATHGGRDEVVEISIGWGGQLESTEADVIESLIVNAVGFVCVFDKLVDRERGIVGLHDGIGHFR